MTKNNGHPPDAATSGDDAASPWNDPSVPVGNAPPTSIMPLVGALLLWAAWIAFLAWMTASRFAHHGA